MNSATAFAPATCGNVGVGFDTLGLALPHRGDTVTARHSDTPGVAITLIEGANLPLDAANNTAAIAAAGVLALAGVPDTGVTLELRKGTPIGSGLGSSAASAAAAATAVIRLLGAPLRKLDLIGPCLDAETAVSGRHADNAAPAILGGLVLVRSTDPLDVVRLPVPAALHIAVATPDHQLLTRESRLAVPHELPQAECVARTAAIAAFVAGCYAGDLTLIARSMSELDGVARARLNLIPGSPWVVEAALDAGALGANISGAGPSMFALCRSAESAERVAAAMADAFSRAGLASTTLTGPADAPGARRA